LDPSRTPTGGHGHSQLCEWLLGSVTYDLITRRLLPS